MIGKGLSSRLPALSSVVSKELHRASLGGISSSFSEFSNGDVRHSSTLVAGTRKGTGGRSSVSGYVATVFGATGFLGRYVVQQLARMGSQVFVPFRGLEDDFKHLKLMGDLGQIVPIKFNVRDEESIKTCMTKSNVVINLIGRDFETNNFSFTELNVDIAERIARLAAEHGDIARFIQFSCLGASASNPAPLYRSKAAGEEIVNRIFPEATIFRPAHLVGTEDRLLNRIALLAKKTPTVPIIGDGENKLQPVHVTDVAAAIVAAIKDDGSSIGKTYELGGPDIFTMNELVQLVYEAIREQPGTFHIPFPIAKLLATPDQIMRKFSFPTPKMVTFSMNNVLAMQKDYVVSPTALTFKELGIIPRKLRGVAIEHLYQWRAGGPAVGTTVG